MPKKKAKPRKKALNRQQAEAQLIRYDRLLGKWIATMVISSRRVEQYRKKVAYYSQRVSDLLAAERDEAVAARQAVETSSGRPLRRIELEDDDG